MNKKHLSFFFLFLATFLSGSVVPSAQNAEGMPTISAASTIQNGTLWKDYASSRGITLKAPKRYGTTVISTARSTFSNQGSMFAVEKDAAVVGYYWCFADDCLYALSGEPKRLFLVSTSSQEIVELTGISLEAFKEAAFRKKDRWGKLVGYSALCGGVACLYAVGNYLFKKLPPPAPSQPAPALPSFIAHIPHELTGKRISLRKLTDSDYDAYCHMMSVETLKTFYVDGEHIVANFGEDVETSKKAFLRIQFNYMLERMRQGKAIYYVIINNESSDKPLMGSVSTTFNEEDSPCGQVAQWINESYRGKGYIQEALALLSTSYFTLTHKKHLTACALISNAASWKALQKVGFKIQKTVTLSSGENYLLALSAS